MFLEAYQTSSGGTMPKVVSKVVELLSVAARRCVANRGDHRVEKEDT